MSHVIAAVSTGASVSAIGIIRLSGDGCIAVADKVFTLNSGKSLGESPDRRLVLGTLHDKQRRVIDQCMAVVSACAPLLHRRGYRGISLPRLPCRAGGGAGGSVSRRGASRQAGGIHQTRLPQRKNGSDAGGSRHRSHRSGHRRCRRQRRRTGWRQAAKAARARFTTT